MEITTASGKKYTLGVPKVRHRKIVSRIMTEMQNKSGLGKVRERMELMAKEKKTTIEALELILSPAERDEINSLAGTMDFSSVIDNSPEIIAITLRQIDETEVPKEISEIVKMLDDLDLGEVMELYPVSMKLITESISGINKKK